MGIKEGQKDPVTACFDQFCHASTLRGIMNSFHQLCDVIGVDQKDHKNFYWNVRSKVTSWKAKSLWAKLDKRAMQKEYKRGSACAGTRVLVIGGGPCGLRAAIEVALLGGKCVLLEKRDRLSRNNVLHLWPYLIHDLKSLGGKKFYGKFCAGAIDHISIRQLQCMLLKVALLVGVEIHINTSFEALIEPSEDTNKEKVGWRISTNPKDHPVSEYEFDCLIGADGKRNTLDGFKRKEFRGKLAIGITANFINWKTNEEARVEEISGVAFIFNQKFFKDLKDDTGIDLENIVYYKDETHYFVMTAKKQSLLHKGVLLRDYQDVVRLLARDNVNQDALLNYAKEAANFSTNGQLPVLEYAKNHFGQADVAMFDFTSLFQAENACRIIQRRGYKLLVTLVGDSLLEPFWPTGSGCARGFLGSMDAAWMIRSFASGVKTPLEVVAERESIYQLLSQTTPESLNKDFAQYTIDPRTRYPNLSLGFFKPHQCQYLFDCDDAAYMHEIVAIPSKRRNSIDVLGDYDRMLKWFQKQLDGYKDFVKISDLSASWKSGHAFCALIHHFRPDLLNIDALPKDDDATVCQKAFDIFEREFGIPPIMTAHDMADSLKADKLGMWSYLSQLFDCFKADKLSARSPDTLTSEESASIRRGTPSQRLHLLSKLNKMHRRSKEKKDKENLNAEALGPVFGSKALSRKRFRDLPEEYDGSYDIDDTMAAAKRQLEVVPGNMETGVRGQNKVSDLAERLFINPPEYRKVELPESKSIGFVTDMRDKLFTAKQEEGDLNPEEITKLQSYRKGSAPTAYIGNLAQQLFGAEKEEAERPPLKQQQKKAIPGAGGLVSTLLNFDTKSVNSDVCYFCQKRVYVMERISAEGYFFHRGCLRCDYCNTVLRLGNYGFKKNEEGEDKFYCFQHIGMKKSSPRKRMSAEDRRKNLEEVKAKIASMAPKPPVCHAAFPPFRPEGRVSTPKVVDKPDGYVSPPFNPMTPERVEFENSIDMEDFEEIEVADSLRDTLSSRGRSIGSDEESSEGDSSDEDEDIDISSLDEEEYPETWEEAYRLADSLKKKRAEESDDDGTESEDLDYDSDEYESEEEEEEEEEEDEAEAVGNKTKPREETKETKDSLKPPTPPQKQTTPTSAAKMNFFGQTSEPVRIDPWSFFRRTGLAKEEVKQEEPKEVKVEVEEVPVERDSAVEVVDVNLGEAEDEKAMELPSSGEDRKDADAEEVSDEEESEEEEEETDEEDEESSEETDEEDDDEVDEADEVVRVVGGESSGEERVKATAIDLDLENQESSGETDDSTEREISTEREVSLERDVSVGKKLTERVKSKESLGRMEEHEVELMETEQSDEVDVVVVDTGSDVGIVESDNGGVFVVDTRADIAGIMDIDDNNAGVCVVEAEVNTSDIAVSETEANVETEAGDTGVCVVETEADKADLMGKFDELIEDFDKEMVDVADTSAKEASEDEDGAINVPMECDVTSAILRETQKMNKDFDNNDLNLNGAIGDNQNNLDSIPPPSILNVDEMFVTTRERKKRDKAARNSDSSFTVSTPGSSVVDLKETCGSQESEETGFDDDISILIQNQSSVEYDSTEELSVSNRAMKIADIVEVLDKRDQEYQLKDNSVKLEACRFGTSMEALDHQEVKSPMAEIAKPIVEPSPGVYVVDMKDNDKKLESELGKETESHTDMTIMKTAERNGKIGADVDETVAEPSPGVYVVDMKTVDEIRKELVFDEDSSKRESTQSYATPKSTNTTNDSIYATPPESSSSSPLSPKRRQSDLDKYYSPCLAAYRKAQKEKEETSPKLGLSRDNKPVIMKDYTLRGTLERKNMKKRDSGTSDVSDALKILLGGVGGGSNATAKPKQKIAVDISLLESDGETENKLPESGQFEVEKGRVKIAAHGVNVQQTPFSNKMADKFYTPMTSVKPRPGEPALGSEVFASPTAARKVLSNIPSHKENDTGATDTDNGLMKPPLPPVSKKDENYSAEELRKQKEAEREKIRERARERARKKSDAELGVSTEFTPRKGYRGSSQSQSDSEGSIPNSQCSSASPTKEKLSLVQSLEDKWPAPKERSPSKERARSTSKERPRLRWPGSGPSSPTKEETLPPVPVKPSSGTENKQIETSVVKMRKPTEPSETKATKRPMSLVMAHDTAIELMQKSKEWPLDATSSADKLPPNGKPKAGDLKNRSDMDQGSDVAKVDISFESDVRASKYSSTSDDSAKETASSDLLRKTPRRSPAFRITAQQNRSSILAEFDDDSDLNVTSPDKVKNDVLNSPVSSTPDLTPKSSQHNTLERLKSQEGMSSASDGESRSGTASASTSDGKAFKRFKDFRKKDKKKTPKGADDEMGAVGGVERKKKEMTPEEKAAKKERRKSLLDLFKTSPKSPDTKSPKKEKKDHGKSPTLTTVPKLRLRTPRSKEKKEKRKQLMREAESDGCLAERAQELKLGEESLKNLTSMTTASQETLTSLSEMEMEGKKMNTAKKVQLAARRQQRQRQLKRLRMAQEIQRQLEEIEVKQRTMEERGVVVEQALRGEGPESAKSEKDLMQEWFNLIHEKNALVRYESELMITARELELEDRHGRLEDSLRERMSNPELHLAPGNDWTLSDDSDDDDSEYEVQAHQAKESQMTRQKRRNKLLKKRRSWTSFLR